jgi:hypothetical protein
MPATPFVPVPSKAVVLGSGSVLSILGPTGVTPAATPVPIGELTDFKFDGFKTSTANNTNFDSGNVVQKLGTLFDWGTLSGTYNNIQSNPGQLALLAAAKSRVSFDFTLQLPPNPLENQTTTGNLYALSGIVVSAGGFDLSQTKVSQASFSIDLNDVKVTAGS